MPNMELNNNIGYSILNILVKMRYFDDDIITKIPEEITKNFINIERKSIL